MRFPGGPTLSFFGSVARSFVALRGTLRRRSERASGLADGAALRRHSLVKHCWMIVMKTFSAKSHEVKRDWLLVDASDKVMGRLASQIALRLRGKHKPEYTPHVDTGDFIVVVNAAKLRVTGAKSEDKVYYRHSGYPGGVYETNFRKMQERFPGRALQIAVKGMLPKGPLGYAMIKKLKIYANGEHPHSAQQPKSVEI
jgi:large subunit ribosomal protein L13